jgi:hypothetical protein
MIAMVSALIVHIVSGDPASKIFVPIDMLLVLTSIWYVSRNDLLNYQISNYGNEHDIL